MDFQGKLFMQQQRTPGRSKARGSYASRLPAKVASHPETVLLMVAAALLTKAGIVCAAMLAEAGHQVILALPDCCTTDAPGGNIATERVVRLSVSEGGEQPMGVAVKALPARFHAIDAVVHFIHVPIRSNALLTASTSAGDTLAGMEKLLDATRAALPGVLGSERGHVIAVTLNDHADGIAGASAYAAGSAQADALCAALRCELDSMGVRFTRIAAGPLEQEQEPHADCKVGKRSGSGSFKAGALSARDVGQAVIWTLDQPRHVVVREIDLASAPLSQPALSPREREVLEWTACGKTSDEISSILDLSVSAVNFHVKSLLYKLECCNKTAAVARAALLGMLA
jgi:DNA-binding CsgD family transcriptional regulator